MKIVVLDGIVENPGDLSWEGFEKLGAFSVYDRTPYDDTEEIIRRIGDAEAVITNKVPITEAIFEACPRIRYVGVLATGYNIIDTKAAAKRGIAVTNIPGYSTESVAQHTFALLLELCAHAGSHDQAVKSGRWSSCPDFCFWDFPLVELHGKTMGLIGFGKIGQAVGRIAQAFGMNVLVYNRTVRPELENEHVKFADLDTVLKESDVVSLHCPLFPETEGIINQERISSMKDGAFLINTSRGPLIVEQDVADALNSGKLGGAAMDVVAKEPMDSNSTLLTAKNCIITPHIAWAAKEARQRLMDIAVGNLEAFLNGTPCNTVQ